MHSLPEHVHMLQSRRAWVLELERLKMIAAHARAARGDAAVELTHTQTVRGAPPPRVALSCVPPAHRTPCSLLGPPSLCLRALLAVSSLLGCWTLWPTLWTAGRRSHALRPHRLAPRAAMLVQPPQRSTSAPSTTATSTRAEHSARRPWPLREASPALALTTTKPFARCRSRTPLSTSRPSSSVVR